MKVIWSPTALGQLDDIYDTIATERDVPTAAKRYFKIEDSVSGLERFPMRGQPVPEKVFEQYYPEFAGLRQLVIRPYRVVYEPTETTCDILGVMRCSHLIGRASLGLGQAHKKT